MAERKERTRLSRWLYAWTSFKGKSKRVAVTSDHAKMFRACDSYYQKIKNVGCGHSSDRRHLNKRAKHSLFTFACVL